MAVIQSVSLSFGFIVSEANDWRSRDEREVSADGLTEPVAAATLLRAGATAADPLLPWNGAAPVVGILCQALGEDTIERRTVLARDAEVVGTDLVLPGATTLAAAAAALLPLGIIVRINKGLHIDVQAPA